MALWQFRCYIVPKLNSIVESNSEELLSWKGKDISLADIAFLGINESWTKDIIQYGKEDETCIQFFYQHELLEEISCSFDLRSLSKEMLDQILNFVKEIEGELFYEKKVYPPDIDEIICLMKKSDAYKFCQNPRKYFNEL